jgi:hypothetical protein
MYVYIKTPNQSKNKRFEMFKLYERKPIVVEAAQWFPYMSVDGVESVKKKMIDPDTAQERVVVDSAYIQDGNEKITIEPGDYVVKTKNGLRRIPYNSFAYDFDEISQSQLDEIKKSMKKPEAGG